MRQHEDRKIRDIYSRILLEQAKNSLNEQEFEAFENKLVKAKYFLYKNYPFFGLLLMKLKTVPTFEIPTMAVDNNSNIYINPNFCLNTLSPDEVVGVLAHEVMHIANLTFFRQKGRQHKLWNVATDYIMNRDLLEFGLSIPSLALIPEKQGDHLFAKISSQRHGKSTLIDITDGEPGGTCEGLYDEIIKFQNSLPKLPPSKGKPSEGEAGNSEGGGGADIDQEQQQEQFDRHISEKEGDETPTPADIPSNDDVYKPSNNEGKTESQKANDARSKVLDAKQTAQRTRGSENAKIPRGFSDKILKPQINWRSLLREFITQSTSSRYNWNRPAKRALSAGYYSPRLKQSDDAVDVVVALDTSGSIQDADLMQFVVEVQKIAQTFQKAVINILIWHTQVYKDFVIDVRGNTIIHREVVNGLPTQKTTQTSGNALAALKGISYQSGGTTIGCIKKYLDARDRGKGVNGLIIFTDGHVEHNPQLPKASKKLGIIVGSGASEDILKAAGVQTHIVDIKS